jgi:hypothetical protein
MFCQNAGCLVTTLKGMAILLAVSAEVATAALTLALRCIGFRG